MAPVRRGSGAALIEHHLFQQRRPKLSLYTCDFVRRQCQHGLNTFLYPHLCNFLCRSSADFFKRSIHACLLWLLPPPLLLLLWLTRQNTHTLSERQARKMHQQIQKQLRRPKRLTFLVAARGS